MTNQVDNSALAGKLKLRRYFLDKYHKTTPLHVLDCCQGSGAIWGVLKGEYEVFSYLGLDVKRQKGRLKLDSRKYLKTDWDHNVIDIDTYGSPWTHWRNLLGSEPKEALTVFLTVGQVSIGGGGKSREDFRALGIPDDWDIPIASAVWPLKQLAVRYHLLSACYCYRIKEIKEVKVPRGPGQKTRYLGVRLEQKPTGAGNSSRRSTTANKER